MQGGTLLLDIVFSDYFIGMRQTKSQYENAIKLSMSRSENHLNFESISESGAALKEPLPQQSQYGTSSLMTLPHSQHCLDIRWIMPEASGVSHPRK